MPEFLLDTHTLIWYLEGSPRLPEPVRILLSDGQAPLFVSAVSWWEIALKTSIGKLTLALPLAEMMQEANRRYIEWLPVLPAHLLRLSQLPFPDNGHRDPFDRMLIAQALEENLTLLSRDDKFGGYAVRRQF